MKKACTFALAVFLCAALVASVPGTARAAAKPYIFGLLLVGPYNDKGYSQAHFEGASTWKRQCPARR